MYEGISQEAREALAVKSLAVELMKEHVFRGDFDRPSRKPDSTGAYHFKDKILRIACRPSGRDGWLNCSVIVQLVRRGWPFPKLEPVLSTGFGVDVTVFRPGQWVDYLTSLAKGARDVQRDRDTVNTRKAEETARNQYDSRFGPVDDSALFKK